jgi:hypothetical protein
MKTWWNSLFDQLLDAYVPGLSVPSLDVHIMEDEDLLAQPTTSQFAARLRSVEQ